jgi:hypothetical protein
LLSGSPNSIPRGFLIQDHFFTVYDSSKSSLVFYHSWTMQKDYEIVTTMSLRNSFNSYLDYDTQENFELPFTI